MECYGYASGQVYPFWPQPSLRASLSSKASCNPGRDQLLTAESRCPFLAISGKAIRAKGPIIYKDDNSLWGSELQSGLAAVGPELFIGE